MPAMTEITLYSEFMNYLASHARENQSRDTRVPPLADLSRELGISVARLREQLEVARAIGLVEVRPRTGIRRLPYTFLPAVRQSLTYALTLDWDHFLAYSDLRNHIEASYWDEAVQLLTPEDHEILHHLIEIAWEKLRGQPIQIPHSEHRRLHLCIFGRLENPFVLGLLEAYWEAYEAVRLDLFADYDYLQQVWKYHQRMVEAICSGDIIAGYEALVGHKELLFHRPLPGTIEEVGTAQALPG